MLRPDITINDAAMAEILKVSEVSQYLWQREWAERNGGNISVDITDKIGEISPANNQFPHNPLTMFGNASSFPESAAGRIYFVKGTGQRIRELREPEKAGCILRIDEQAAGYYLLWGGNEQADFKPTSEFISHVEILESKRAAGIEHLSVVHTHPIELIAFSHYPKVSKSSKAYTDACWRMLPEVRAFVPRGIGLVPYSLPGSKLIAEGTVNILKDYDVAVWEKHGAVSTGVDALEAFDFIDVANKGAKLHLMCLASGFEPEGISDDGMDELETVFNL